MTDLRRGDSCSALHDAPQFGVWTLSQKAEQPSLRIDSLQPSPQRLAAVQAWWSKRVFSLPLQERQERMGSCFHDTPPPPATRSSRGCSLDRAPNWGIHKVQTNQDKTLPAARDEARGGLSVRLLSSVRCRDLPCSVICHLQQHVGINRQTCVNPSSRKLIKSSDIQAAAAAFDDNSPKRGSVEGI